MFFFFLFFFFLVVEALSMCTRSPSTVITKLVATLTLNRITSLCSLHCGSTIRTLPEPCFSHGFIVDHLVSDITIRLPMWFLLANHTKFLMTNSALDILDIIGGYLENSGTFSSGTKVKLCIRTDGDVEHIPFVLLKLCLCCKFLDFLVI